MNRNKSLYIVSRVYYLALHAIFLDLSLKCYYTDLAYDTKFFMIFQHILQNRHVIANLLHHIKISNLSCHSRPLFSQGDVAVGRITRLDVAKVLVSVLDGDNAPAAAGKTMEVLALSGTRHTCR
jgi:hypothetical protein